MARKRPYRPDEIALLDAIAAQPLSLSEAADQFLSQFPGRTKAGVAEKIKRTRAQCGYAEPESVVTPFLDTSYGSEGGTVSGMVSEPVKTLDDLIRVCEIDTAQFEVIQWQAKAFQQGSKDANGNMQAQTLYSVSARLRPLPSLSLYKQLEGVLADIQAQTKLVQAPLWSPPPSSGRALSLYVPDLHLGKMAWAPESGENYDSDIAAHLYLSTAKALLEQAAHLQPELVVLPIGSDMLNVDSARNTTTGGTPQDVDGRHMKTFRRAVALIRQVVEDVILPTGAKVRLIRVRGNHDEESSFYLGEVLRAVYDGWPQVELPAEADYMRARQYWRWGKTLVMYAHGDTEKRSDLPYIMARECATEWAETAFHEAHTGHLHRQKQTVRVAMEDQKGFIHEELPSLSAADAWHYLKGYIGSLRLAKCFVYDRDGGRIATFDSHAQQFLGRLGALPESA